MDGLIRGLVDVALGGGLRDEDDHDSGPDTRDERSRSSWAQVLAPLNYDLYTILMIISVIYWSGWL